MVRRAAVGVCLLVSSCVALSQAQPSKPPMFQLDPTRAIVQPETFQSFHHPLPEQYVWSNDRPGQTQQQRDAPRYFRAHFEVRQVPGDATLYVAGPRAADVWINGAQVGHFNADPQERLTMQVFSAKLSAGALKAGGNTIGIAAAQGEALVVKIVPAAVGLMAPAIMMSGPGWKASLTAANGWQQAGFDDKAWPEAEAQGAIESNIDFFQVNNDAGMYDWPGYAGESPFLAHMFLPAVKVQDVYAGNGSFENVEALTAVGANPRQEFAVTLVDDPAGRFVPGITLDFGREVTGRVQVASDSDEPVTVSIAYGESLGELNNEPYLGVDPLTLPAHGTGVGPKSAFRYARVRFLSGPLHTRFRAIRLEDIYYPVHYLGSFESSDPLLNRIWETGAYTSHLCMQDDIWDAPKRDRARWMGDTDVSGRVIDAVFADHFLVEDTLTRLIGKGEQPVNGIPGYSSYWFTEMADYLRHEGRTEYLQQEHDQLLSLLHVMDMDFDAQNRFINHTKEWLYVDWTIGLNGDTPETRRATTLEYVRAYRDGAWLLRQIGDTQNAEHFEQRANAIAQASQATEFADGSFGPRWQTNAMAVLARVATPDQYASIWSNVLAHVGEPTYRPDVISPYYGSYVLDTMAEMNHRDAALKWIREYWGGMIAEGATSFWEAYDPAWPKDDDPHVVLQADDTAGYQTSLAHGWASGPSYWLMEQVLGIQPTGVGFAKTTIRPDLVDLQWARGGEPTPHGLLKVDLSHNHAEHSLHMVVDLPAGVEATVLYPVSPGAGHVLVNGKMQAGTPAENGARVALTLDQGGHYEIHEQ